MRPAGFRYSDVEAVAVFASLFDSVQRGQDPSDALVVFLWCEPQGTTAAAAVEAANRGAQLVASVFSTLWGAA